MPVLTIALSVRRSGIEPGSSRVTNVGCWTAKYNRIHPCQQAAQCHNCAHTIEEISSVCRSIRFKVRRGVRMCAAIGRLDLLAGRYRPIASLDCRPPGKQKEWWSAWSLTRSMPLRLSPPCPLAAVRCPKRVSDRPACCSLVA
jgi:hypothetical protein